MKAVDQRQGRVRRGFFANVELGVICVSVEVIVVDDFTTLIFLLELKKDKSKHLLQQI